MPDVTSHEFPTSPPHDLNRPLTLGVLGAGQLAQMLVHAARRLGYKTKVLADGPGDPAAPEADQVIYGKPTEHHVLAQVFDHTAWVAIESELIDPVVLSNLEETGLAARLRPRHDVIARFSDKLLQKKGLRELAIPTLPWEELMQCPVDSGAWCQLLAARFPGGYVVKWTRGGYDGHGVLLVRSPDHVEKTRFDAFLADGFARGGAIYAEELCPFVAEVAVVAVRSVQGELTTYPVVLTKQDHGICSEVLGPASAHGVTSSAIDAAVAIARKVGEGFGLVGTYAVEFFLRPTPDGQGEVMVNEIAPRVHNSGHYTQDAAVTSQFENHWRGILGQPLGSTETTPFFGMVNILGPLGKTGAIDAPKDCEASGVSLHWYNKAESRPRRKLGHINIHAATREELKARMQLVRAHIKAWETAWKESP
jgi:5-(carboxyamino)imidazole ribonucleotide synthase